MTHIFLTGFPGFIGYQLVQSLFDQNPSCTITALVHPSMMGQAARPAQSGLADLAKKERDTFKILAGDITQKNLGLLLDASQEVLSQTTHVFHLAAIYDLTVPQALATHVNVHGTQNMLDFFSNASSLKRFIHISTCYVSGKREGIITSDELHHTKGFHNFYESTKYESEIRVNQAKDKMPVTIFRPAIVVGDSQTGKTAKFDGPYVVMKLLHRLRWFLTLIPNLGYKDFEVNTIPVDYLVKVISYLSFEEKSLNKTYQVCDQNPPSTEDFFEMLAQMIGNCTPYQAPTLREFILWKLSLPGVAFFTGVSKQALAYFKHPAKYRCPHLSKDLKGTNITLSNLKDTYRVLYRYMRENI